MLFGTRNTILDLVFLNFENNVSYIVMSSRWKMTLNHEKWHWVLVNDVSRVEIAMTMLFGTRNTILDLVFLNFENDVSYITMSSRWKMTWFIGHCHKRVYYLAPLAFFDGIISIWILHKHRKTIPSAGFKKFLSMRSYNAMTSEKEK